MSKTKTTNTSEARISFFPLKNGKSTQYNIATSLKIKDYNEKRKIKALKILHNTRSTQNLAIQDHSDDFASYFIIYSKQIDPALDLINQVTSGIKLFHGFGEKPIKKKDLKKIARERLSRV